MSEIDQQFIEYVVKSLVGNPGAVHIDRRVDEKGVLLELTVDPEDLGRVIGKRGATAQSLRTLLRALGTKNDARYNLKIVDNGTGASQPAGDDVATPSRDAATATADEDIEAPAETAQPESEPEPATETVPAPTPEPEATTGTTEEDQTSDRVAQARRELADLDDLDV